MHIYCLGKSERPPLIPRASGSLRGQTGARVVTFLGSQSARGHHFLLLEVIPQVCGWGTNATIPSLVKHKRPPLIAYGWRTYCTHTIQSARGHPFLHVEVAFHMDGLGVKCAHSLT